MKEWIDLFFLPYKIFKLNKKNCNNFGKIYKQRIIDKVSEIAIAYRVLSWKPPNTMRSFLHWTILWPLLLDGPPGELYTQNKQNQLDTYHLYTLHDFDKNYYVLYSSM